MVKTTLASACTINATKIVVAASTSLVAGARLKVDQEEMLIAMGYSTSVNGVNVPVIRAQGGTVSQAHPSGANVIEWQSTDTVNPDPQLAVTTPIAGRARVLTSYSAAGAITLPTAGNDAVAVINGTNALAMTLAAPGKDLDGSLLIIVSNGSAAHTVAPATALNNAGSNFDTAITFAAGGKQVVPLLAINEFWCIFPSVAAGTLTNVTVTYS
jgi:hypothetical protein